MDSHKHSGQVARLDVVDSGRRRRWSDAEKFRIVSESLSGPRLGSSTARRYGISPSLLFAWRRALQVVAVAKGAAEGAFVPVKVTAEPRSAVAADASSGRVEIVLRDGRRVLVETGIDVVALARLVAVLERP